MDHEVRSAAISLMLCTRDAAFRGDADGARVPRGETVVEVVRLPSEWPRTLGILDSAGRRSFDHNGNGFCGPNVKPEVIIEGV